MPNNETSFAPAPESTAIPPLSIEEAQQEALSEATRAVANRFPSFFQSTDPVLPPPGKEPESLEFNDIYDSQRKSYLKGRVSNDIEVSQPVCSFEDAKVFFLGAVAPHLHNMSRFDAVNESLLSVGPALDEAVDYYSEKASRLALDEFLSDGREFCAANAALAARFVDMLSEPLPVQQRGELTAEAAMIMMPPNYGLRRLTKEELGLANVEVLVASKKMRDGLMTVNIEYMSQPKFWPHVRLGELFKSIKNLAQREGASAVKVICGDEKAKIFENLR